MSSPQNEKTSSIDPAEIQSFKKDSAYWWDETGPFAPLHKLNPERITYIRDQMEAHFSVSHLKGLSVLDVGSGGGLVCEPMARLGADVTGIDADSQAVQVATEHAADGGLEIAYTCAAVEDGDDQFDCVLALEIIEHVKDPSAFIRSCSARVKPGGLLIVSTLNRTVMSFLVGIVAAEYVMRWVPKGTHNWKQFVKPAELGRMMRMAGLLPKDATGITYEPRTDSFALEARKTPVNYLLSATRPLG